MGLHSDSPSSPRPTEKEWLDTRREVDLGHHPAFHRSTSAPSWAEKLLNDSLTREKEARLEAERRLSFLSPLERFFLFTYARLMTVVRCPAPRCGCCGGPTFWLLAVMLSFRVIFGARTAWAPLRGALSYDPLRTLILGEVADSHLDAALSLDHYLAQREAFSRPATQFAKRASSKKMPVVMLPGMTSTALEVWRGVGCYAHASRQRVWASGGSTATFLLDPDCLQRHLRLDPLTWTDPIDVRVRACTGLSAADAFGPLNLWGELIVNLAMLGYDETSLALLGYDWRLAPQLLEKRDRYLTRLRRTIETLVETNDGAKVAILAHSLGANHALYFFNWVAEKAGPSWVEDHVAAFVPIGGAFLGAPKGLAYVVAGEMTETVGGVFAQLSELHGGLGKETVANLTRSWGSVAAVLPKGGKAIWGDEPLLELSLEDEEEQEETTRGYRIVQDLLAAADGDLDAAETNVFLRDLLPEYMALVDSHYALEDPQEAELRPNWNNPLTSPLPSAPSTAFYCLYGVGRETPRTIRLRALQRRRNGRGGPESEFEILKRAGIINGDGDGTVPLLSLGYMCAKGWSSRRLNPARIRVVTKEYRHEDLAAHYAIRRPFKLVQGLANDKDADHITILGNRALITDIIDIVLGGPETTLRHSHITSDICRLADEAPLNLDALNDGAIDACNQTNHPRRKKPVGLSPARKLTHDNSDEL